MDWQAASLLQRAAWVVGELPHEVEETLAKRGGVAELARYAVYVHKRFPEYEPAIALTGRFAVAYAQRVLGLSENDVFAWIKSMKEQQ